MSAFPGFGGWFNQNNEHPPKAESRRSHENVKSNSVSEKHTNLKPWYDEPGKNEANEPGEVRSKNLYAVDPKYYDVYELKRQAGLWLGPSKTNPWHDAPAKVKAKYKKHRMILIKVFEGSYKVEALYVYSERLCKHMEPKSVEEYKKCSGGQGRIASKVTMDQYFKPYLPFNLPPLSWYIRRITIKNTNTALRTLQTWGINDRSPGLMTTTDEYGNVTRHPDKKENNKH